MIRCRVSCDECDQLSALGEKRGWMFEFHVEPNPEAIAKALAGFGRTEQDGKHYCERHTGTVFP